MGALLGFMLGYVLGAKAGPEGYDELRKAWETIVNSEEFKGLLGVGTTFVQGMLQQSQQSVGDTLSRLFSDKGQLGDAWKKFSGNGPLMDAWKVLSNHPRSNRWSCHSRFARWVMMQRRAARRSCVQ